jgi:hypothetical protein
MVLDSQAAAGLRGNGFVGSGGSSNLSGGDTGAHAKVDTGLVCPGANRDFDAP